MAKRRGRPGRWDKAASDAVNAVSILKELQEEYQDWLDRLPESLESGTLDDKLQVVCDLDLEGALDTLNEAEAVDLPLGYGRD